MRENLEKIGKRRKNGSIYETIQRMLIESGALAYCRTKFSEYVEHSIDSLNGLNDNNYKSYLIQLAESLLIWR